MSIHWNSSFEPEEIQLLSAALERAWNFVRSSGEFGVDAPEFCRASLATHIMATARAGERDPLQLANGAIQRYRQQRAQQLAAEFRKLASGPAAE